MVLATIVAFAVTVVCLIPPGVHFVTGPIGPAIGGYVAGNRFRLAGAEIAVVGLLMGSAIGGSSIVAFEYSNFMPDLALQASIPLSVIAALYVGVLGSVGAWIASARTV